MLVHTRTKVYDFNVHLVWVTKYRQSLFNTSERQTAMTRIIGDIAQANQLTIQEFEVLPDHIHLLVSFDPQRSVSNVIKSLKGASARQWFKEFPETKKQLWGGHLWSPSYFVGTVGNVSQNIVAEYIKNQLTEYSGPAQHVNSSHE